MKIEKIGRLLTMDALTWKAGGVEFLITGTQIVEGVCWVDFKNVETGENFTREHQLLCRRIAAAQDKPKVEQKKKPTKYIQTGINL